MKLKGNSTPGMLIQYVSMGLVLIPVKTIGVKRETFEKEV